MTILCDYEIKALCTDGMVPNYDEALINPASLDLRLGDAIMIESSDQINPDHYKQGPVEAIDVIEAAIARAPNPVLGNCQGHVLRYVLRMWDKGDPAVNAAKAKWYLRRLLAKLEG